MIAVKQRTNGIVRCDAQKQFKSQTGLLGFLCNPSEVGMFTAALHVPHNHFRG